MTSACVPLCRRFTPGHGRFSLMSFAIKKYAKSLLAGAGAVVLGQQGGGIKALPRSNTQSWRGSGTLGEWKRGRRRAARHLPSIGQGLLDCPQPCWNAGPEECVQNPLLCTGIDSKYQPAACMNCSA